MSALPVNDGVHEFVCCECGSGVVSFIRTNEFDLCVTCLFLPGWHLDPRLRTILGPNLPALDGAAPPNLPVQSPRK